MGWIKDAKTSALTTEARRAIEEGHTVFAPRLNPPSTAGSLSCSVSGWAEMVEAIEECGWVLAHWTATDDSKGRPIAYPLFRRRV